MHQKFLKLLTIAAAAVALQACATVLGVTHPMSEQMVSEGAERMNRDQVIQHLAGKTQVWASGGAYFQADGDVYVKWEGKIFPRRVWSVDERGRACISFPEQGRLGAFRPEGIERSPTSATFPSSCSDYFMKDGEVWVVTVEVFGERQQSPGAIDSDVRDGNRLDDLAWDSQI